MANKVIKILDKKAELEVVAAVVLIELIYSDDIFTVERLDPALFSEFTYFHVTGLGDSRRSGDDFNTIGRVSQEGLLRELYEFIKEDFDLDADLRKPSILNVINSMSLDTPLLRSASLVSMIDGYSANASFAAGFNDSKTYLMPVIFDAVEEVVITSADVDANKAANGDVQTLFKTLFNYPEDITQPGVYDMGYFVDDYECNVDFNTTNPDAANWVAPNVKAVVGYVRQTNMWKAIGMNKANKGLYVIAPDKSTVMSQVAKIIN